MESKLISLIILVLLCGCKEYTEIKQEVSNQYNYQNDGQDYLVSTKVWVRNWARMPESLPYWEVAYSSTFDLEIVKKLELQKAKAVEKRIGEKYEMLSREE